jgi:hypothetical protein
MAPNQETRHRCKKHQKWKITTNLPTKYVDLCRQDVSPEKDGEPDKHITYLNCFRYVYKKQLLAFITFWHAICITFAVHLRYKTVSGN